VDPVLIKHGPNPTFHREGGETLQVEKQGGNLGEDSRFYTISWINGDLIDDPGQKTFIDMVDALGSLFGQEQGDSSGECLAFRMEGLNEEPSSWAEVAGYVWNGASIEQIAEEILRDEDL